jgi:hypothetical protein
MIQEFSVADRNLRNLRVDVSRWQLFCDEHGRFRPNYTGYNRGMNKTKEEKKQHDQKMDAILNEMRDEQMAWFGWTDGMGKYVALGEYILELTESDQPHDSWLMDARKSYLDWKKVHNISLTPPTNRKAG